MTERTYRVGIVGLGRMGSTIDDEGHSDLPYSVAASTLAGERPQLAAGCLPKPAMPLEDRATYIFHV